MLICFGLETMVIIIPIGRGHKASTQLVSISIINAFNNIYLNFLMIVIMINIFMTVCSIEQKFDKYVIIEKIIHFCSNFIL